MRLAPFTSASLLMTMIAATAGAPRATRAQMVLVYDQQHRTVSPDTGDSGRALERLGGTRFRLRHPATVRVRVVNTNTALYRVTATPSEVPASALSPLQAFSARLKPFLPDIAALAIKARGGGDRAEALRNRSIMPEQPPSNDAAVRAAWLAGRRVEDDLRRLDEVIAGPSGVNSTLAKTLEALDAMRTADASTVARALRDSLGLPARDSCSSAAGPNLAGPAVSALADLPSGAAAVDSGLTNTLLTADALKDFRDRLSMLSAGADSALRQSESIVGAAYHAQRLAQIAASACSQWNSDPSRVTGTTGQEFIVRIEPRAEPEIARVAGDAASTRISVLPPAGIVEPALGLSLLDVPNGRFTKQYGVRPVSGGGNEVFSQSYQDARFSWGVTAGLSWRPVNWRQSTGWALWLPELTVGESSDQKELGLGAAVSFHLLKLGAGGMWIRHTELVGSRVGDPVASKDALQTRDTYGAPMLYMSLTIFDWSPFTAK